jgi:hypothetical protein
MLRDLMIIKDRIFLQSPKISLLLETFFQSAHSICEVGQEQSGHQTLVIDSTTLAVFI